MTNVRATGQLVETVTLAALLTSAACASSNIAGGTAQAERKVSPGPASASRPGQKLTWTGLLPAGTSVQAREEPRCFLRDALATPIAAADADSVYIPLTRAGADVRIPSGEMFRVSLDIEKGAAIAFPRSYGLGWVLLRDASAVTSLWDGRVGSGESCKVAAPGIERALELAVSRMDLGVVMCRYRVWDSESTGRQLSCRMVADSEGPTGHDAALSLVPQQSYVVLAVATGEIQSLEVDHDNGKATVCAPARAESASGGLIGAIAYFNERARGSPTEASRPVFGHMVLRTKGCVGWIVATAANPMATASELRVLLNDATASSQPEYRR